MGKLIALLRVFRKGEEVANASTWANRAAATEAVLGTLVALVAVARAFGADISVSDTDLQNVAIVIVALAFIGSGVVRTITHRDVGLPASAPPADDTHRTGGHSPY